jgi:hypothetical protein
VNQSAIVFHEIRNDNPGAARSLAGVIREMRGMLHHFVDSAEEETAKQMCLDSIRVVEQEVRFVLFVWTGSERRKKNTHRLKKLLTCWTTLLPSEETCGR